MKNLFAIVGLVALGIPCAYATVEVRIINTAGGGDTGWVQCAGTSCSFLGAVGNYNIALNLAIQSNSTNPLLDMTYNANTLIAHAGTIEFEAIADGYTLNIPGTQLVANGNSTLGDTVGVAAFGGNNNTICAAGVNGCSASSNGTLLEAGSGLTENLNFTKSGGGNTVSPYELGLLLLLVNPVNAGNASGDIQLNAVPEPASVALLGGVLLVAVTAIRRKTRRA